MSTGRWFIDLVLCGLVLVSFAAVGAVWSTVVLTAWQRHRDHRTDRYCRCDACTDIRRLLRRIETDKVDGWQ